MSIFEDAHALAVSMVGSFKKWEKTYLISEDEINKLVPAMKIMAEDHNRILGIIEAMKGETSVVNLIAPGGEPTIETIHKYDLSTLYELYRRILGKDGK